jgi:hypothetical protein
MALSAQVIVASAGIIVSFFDNNFTALIIFTVLTALIGMLAMGFEQFGIYKIELDLYIALNGEEMTNKFDIIKNKKYEQFEMPSESDLRSRLLPSEYDVLIRGKTEPAFDNVLNHHYEPGIYVDKISYEPLFVSTTKFDSGSG